MIHRQPVQWYVDKLERGEPFSSLLYGDGEFLVASRRRTGRAMQNGEVVTTALEDEMRASFLMSDDGPPIYRGTEPFLVEPWTYGGQDKESVNASATALQLSLPPGAAFDWYDGTVWDTAVRNGELGPLIRALNNCSPYLISNRVLANSGPIKWTTHSVVSDTNGCSELDRIENFAKEHLYSEWPRNRSGGYDRVLVLCMGLGAIPLIMRLRRKNPNATYLDLGSTFDVFARIGAERGWRQEVYSNSERYADLIRRNLEGTT